MKNNRIISTALVTALVSVLSPAAAVASPTPPNIIFIMADDMGFGDLACHGHPFLKTPHLDKLHAESTRFTDFQVSPTCAPTRAALLSGRHPFKCGVTHTILERERMALSAMTIAQVLKTAGYTTGIFGKWHLGEADEYQPDRRGFDEMFIHGSGAIGESFPGTQGAIPGTGYFNPILRHNDRFVRTEGYCTDVFFDQALGWIHQNKERPFFAYIPTNAPHLPYLVAEHYKALYQGKCTDSEAAFFGMITNIDENMGRLIAKLAEWKLADNTLLIFTSDNGTSGGDHVFNAGMKGKKGSLNEGATRVPLFFRLPGSTKPGVDIDHLARHYDLFPTLAAFAGAAIPAGYAIDGRSLKPLIDNPATEWPDRLTFFHLGRWGKAGAPPRFSSGSTKPDDFKLKNFAVRSERWRLVGPETLYDIKADPGEQHNVAAQHPETVSRMLQAYETWWDEVRPMMINEDATLDTGKPFIEHYNKQQEAGGIPLWKPAPGARP